MINETDQIVYIIEVVEIREIVIMRIIRKSKSEKIEILRVDKSVFQELLAQSKFSSLCLLSGHMGLSIFLLSFSTALP